MNDEGRLEQVVYTLTYISVYAWIEVGEYKFLSGQVLKPLITALLTLFSV